MSTRLVSRRLHAVNVGGTILGLTEEQLKELLATKPAVATAVKPAKLRNRGIRKSATFPCRRTPDPLYAAAIIWPGGVPKMGCGRSFVTEKRRDLHETGDGWNLTRFPHGCLDAILPADLRDSR